MASRNMKYVSVETNGSRLQMDRMYSVGDHSGRRNAESEDNKLHQANEGRIVEKEGRRMGMGRKNNMAWQRQMHTSHLRFKSTTGRNKTRMRLSVITAQYYTLRQCSQLCVPWDGPERADRLITPWRCCMARLVGSTTEHKALSCTTRVEHVLEKNNLKKN